VVKIDPAASSTASETKFSLAIISSPSCWRRFRGRGGGYFWIGLGEGQSHAVSHIQILEHFRNTYGLFESSEGWLFLDEKATPLLSFGLRQFQKCCSRFLSALKSDLN